MVKNINWVGLCTLWIAIFSSGYDIYLFIFYIIGYDLDSAGANNNNNEPQKINFVI